MSQPSQPQWLWDPEFQQYYYFDALRDVLILDDGRRMPRPPNNPRTAFASISSQAARRTLNTGYAGSLLPLDSSYAASTMNYRYNQPSARPDTQNEALVDPSRSQPRRQNPAHAFSGQINAPGQQFSGTTMSSQDTRADAVRVPPAPQKQMESPTQNLAAMGVSPQTPQPGPPRQPQPVNPTVSCGPEGQRIVQATDPTTKIRTIFQTGPPHAITDPDLYRSGIYASSRLWPAEHDVTERLFKSFRLRDQPRKFFTVGKVFSVLWVEPAGESNTGVTGLEIGTTIGRYGERAFSKVRRFVVVREGDNYCSALPITSYGHRGVGKPGVKKSEHSIIFTTKTAPELMPQELPQRGEDGMRPQAIRVDPDDPIDKLDALARLDYGKVHTIQHNIKVKSFGKVHAKSVITLVTQFGDVWRTVPRTVSVHIQRPSRDDELSMRSLLESVDWKRRPSDQYTVVSSRSRLSAASQACSDAQSAPSDADRVAVLQTAFRAAVHVLVKQGGLTEDQAGKAIQDELARRRKATTRCAVGVDDQFDSNGEDGSSDEDNDAEEGQPDDTNYQHSAIQRQKVSSSLRKTGPAQQSSIRNFIILKEDNSCTQDKMHDHAHPTSTFRSSQAEVQADRAQAETLTA